MAQSPVKKNMKSPTGINWLIFGTCFTTLYFNTNLQDPFNSPKLWIILILASTLVGYLLVKFQEKDLIKTHLKIILLVAMFAISITLSVFTSDVPITSFIGETQRRNGFICYISLAIIFMYTMLTINYHHISKLFKSALFTGFILSIYGLLQSTGNDFVKWNNPYNSVIATVGNPNFSSAIMAVLATICFGVIFLESFSRFYKMSAFLTFLLLTLTIYRSDASQGLVSLLVGTGSLIIFYSYRKNKKIGLCIFGVGLSGFFLLVLGMLQYGPLKSFIYKDSVSVRGFYWRAGIKMLEDNLFNGVGLDRYGANFKLYREPAYSVRYGFDITSTNAHNVPIQMFATGGLLLGISYLLIVVVTLMAGAKAIKFLPLAKQKIMITLLASYLAFQAQTLVSIDNIGISIWGWVISGSIIALAQPDLLNSNKYQKSSTSFALLQPAISGAFLLLSLLLVVIPMVKSESSMYKARNWFNPQVPQNLKFLNNETDKIFSNKLSDSSYKFTSAVYLYQSGQKIIAKAEMIKLVERDPKNLEALNYLALISEEEGDLQKNLAYRIKIDLLDPWNARNLLEMAKIYNQLNKGSQVSQLQDRLTSFAPNTEEAKSINNLFRVS